MTYTGLQPGVTKISHTPWILKTNFVLIETAGGNFKLLLELMQPHMMLVYLGCLLSRTIGNSLSYGLNIKSIFSFMFSSAYKIIAFRNLRSEA